ncbi:MAG: hypothetical protein ACYTGX_18525 [Planctomycetota bacterium]|jgi:hypothetical protein
MRRGLLLILALGLVVVVGAAVGGWQALRTEARPSGPTGWYGVRAVVRAAPPPPAPGTPFRLLPARITITWNVATRQAKVYVGQSFVGIVGQGGETRAAQQIAKLVTAAAPSGRPLESDLDADPWLPIQRLLQVLSALERLPSTDSEVRAPVRPALLAEPTARKIFSTPPPIGRRAKPSGSLPKIEYAPPIPSKRESLILAYDAGAGIWRAGDDARALELVRPMDMEQWLIRELSAHDNRKELQVLLSLPKDTPWEQAQAVAGVLLSQGVTDFYFRAAPPQAPKPEHPNAK